MEFLKKTFCTCSHLWFTVPLRLSLGIIFMAHGGQKLFGWFGGYGLSATAQFFSEKLGMNPGMLWALLAGSGEFFGGLLVLIGLATRFGALNLAVTMLVAMVHVHWGPDWFPKFFMQSSGIEFTLALLCSSLALLISGGGALSVDAYLCKAKESCQPEK